MADLKNLKGVSDKDKAMIAEAEGLLGPEPTSMGTMKNYFWGNVREDLLFPYPDIAKKSPEEVAEADRLVAAVDDYMRTEHPSLEIDREQHIPERTIKRLFELGVMGMTISKEFGGLGMGITSYNRVLEVIGKYCGSTAVLVSAHQSIGCKAVMLYGNEEQKKEWLPKLASEWVSAFCLSEPQVGCDAGGVETRCELSEDGEHYILNGEKKWATSGAISGLFTVMAKQKMPDGKDKVSALVCHPWMEGIEIFSKNRSKCGIRGTWQARIRFHDVKVPKFNLLGKEGRGLNIALSCLNFGRCTLSAGMLGGARKSMDQAIKWARLRYQFNRPIGEFDLVRQKVARMNAYVYAMDSLLYLSTGMLDRGDEDIMVETAVCKVFCSEFGWRTVNDAMQIMGGESYMTENEIERIFRDSRINTIVEGANEVMQSFVFAYGGKQLAEHMLGVKGITDAKKFGEMMKPAFVKAAMPLASQVLLHRRPRRPVIGKLHQALIPYGDRLTTLVRELTYQFKQMAKRYDADIVKKQVVQARLADAAIFIHAWAAALSKLDSQIRAGEEGPAFERDKAAAIHFFDLMELEIHQRFKELYENADDTLDAAADKAFAYSDTLSNSLFIVPESTPTDARGTGREVDQSAIQQFPGLERSDTVEHGTGREHTAEVGVEH